MSQTKYKLPEDLKNQCLSLVRGYERRVRLYHDRRDSVIYASAPPNVLKSKDKDGKEICEFGGRSGKPGDATYDKAMKLERIESLYDTQAMRAVEQAKLTIGVGWDEAQRQKLRAAIWDSCMLGRNFRLSCYDLPLGSNNFYERRRRFLWCIAKNMGFL